MSFSNRIFVISNIKLSPNASFKEAFSVAEKILKRLGISTAAISFSLFKKSIDARHKNDIKIVYSVAVEGELSEGECAALVAAGATEISSCEPEFAVGGEPLSAPPVVVGTGPCGLFTALLLAEHGYRPVVLERGARVSERISAVSRFVRTRTFDLETNIQFGAGGAGTFSDGKLITRINDPYSSYVIGRLIEFGAPEEIRYLSKPHIGTDILSEVVDNILARIESLGACVHYNTKFLRAVSDSSGRVTSVITDRGEIKAGALVLAIGHSARDTYQSLFDFGITAEAKPFSVGMRIEHLTEDIDCAMYGNFAGNKNLGHAEYALSYNTKVRGVYTFCMCPGGEVIAATSQDGGVVTNGMSRHARAGRNSNSAVVCSVFKEDYGATPAAAIELQRKIERAAYAAGGADYSAPMITVGDFLKDKLTSMPKRIMPTYMNGEHLRLASPYDYLPKFVCDNIKNALSDFDSKINGFAAADAVLTGAETRTSAPIRLLRDRSTGVALGYDNIYPAGEGAGYAGGITSAAVDGIRCATALIGRYRNSY